MLFVLHALDLFRIHLQQVTEIIAGCHSRETRTENGVVKEEPSKSVTCNFALCGECDAIDMLPFFQSMLSLAFRVHLLLKPNSITPPALSRIAAGVILRSELMRQLLST